MFATKSNYTLITLPDTVTSVDDSKIGNWFSYLQNKEHQYNKNIWGSNRRKNKNIQAGREKGGLIENKKCIDEIGEKIKQRKIRKRSKNKEKKEKEEKRRED